MDETSAPSRFRLCEEHVSDGSVDGQYDLVTVFEALHDMVCWWRTSVWRRSSTC